MVNVEQAETLKICPHLEFLSTPQFIPGTKREVRFLGSGYIFNFSTGENHWEPILRGMKDTPSGRITVTSDWMPVKFCPVCGVAVESEQTEELGNAH